MNVLLDVNVLVALAWPNHVHHGMARGWFKAHSSDGWATCPATEHGFVRVSTNPAAVGEPASMAEAVLLLDRLRSLGRHEFWTDDVSAADTAARAGDRLATHRQVSDAHLLALASRRAGRVATFDHGLVHLAGDGAESVVVISAGTIAP